MRTSVMEQHALSQLASPFMQCPLYLVPYIYKMRERVFTQLSRPDEIVFNFVYKNDMYFIECKNYMYFLIVKIKLKKYIHFNKISFNIILTIKK